MQQVKKYWLQEKLRKSNYCLCVIYTTTLVPKKI